MILAAPTATPPVSRATRAIITATAATKASGDGIKLDGDTCDRDWFRVMLTVNRTYKLQLESESGTTLLIDGVYRNGVLFQKGDGPYTARSTSIHYISVAGTDGCSGLHGCTGGYTLSVTQV